MKLGDELGGHLVSGHVDGLAQVVAREDLTDMARFTLRAPHALSRFIAPKGSVALDGVSLTVNEVDGDTFTVLIIPHTLGVTTFGALRQGEDINLEIDTMARYAARLMDTKWNPCFPRARLLGRGSTRNLRTWPRRRALRKSATRCAC